MLLIIYFHLLNLLFFSVLWCYSQVAAYDTVGKKMSFFDPSRAQDFLFISGTKVWRLSLWLASIP